MARRYRFGDVEIDLQGFRLLKGGQASCRLSLKR